MLWKYDSEMQISFGVYATLAEAVEGWKTIRGTGVYVSNGGDVSHFTPDDFDPGSWFIETYEPGVDPSSMVIDERWS